MQDLGLLDILAQKISLVTKPTQNCLIFNYWKAHDKRFIHSSKQPKAQRFWTWLQYKCDLEKSIKENWRMSINELEEIKEKLIKQ